MLRAASHKWGICTEVFLPSRVFTRLSGDSWEARLVRALAIRGVGLLASAVAPCPKSWLPQVQLAGSSWLSWRGCLRGVPICVHSGPAKLQGIGHLQADRTMVSSDLAAAASSCFAECGHQQVALQGIESD